LKVNTKYHFEDLSSHLFWDVDTKSMSLEKTHSFIIQRVLEYGFIEDWNFIKGFYGLSTIADNAKKFRSLDKRALHFISSISKTPLEEFNIEKVLSAYENKYHDGNIFMALKSLNYFEDAEKDQMPYMLNTLSYLQAKKTTENE